MQANELGQTFFNLDHFIKNYLLKFLNLMNMTFIQLARVGQQPPNVGKATSNFLNDNNNMNRNRNLTLSCFHENCQLLAGA